MVERLEEQRSCPGVVHEHRGAMAMGDLRDRRDIHHLEGERAGGLGEDCLGVGLEQRLYARTQSGIKIGGLNAHALENAIADVASWPIDGVGDQQVITR